MEDFINWFQSHEAQLDTSALGITEFSPSEGGRGAIALKYIPVCGRFVLFPVMDQLYLNIRRDMCCSRYREVSYCLRVHLSYLCCLALMLGRKPVFTVDGVV